VQGPEGTAVRVELDDQPVAKGVGVGPGRQPGHDLPQERPRGEAVGGRVPRRRHGHPEPPAGGPRDVVREAREILGERLAVSRALAAQPVALDSVGAGLRDEQGVPGRLDDDAVGELEAVEKHAHRAFDRIVGE
jgi:hypothetical protein